MINISIRQLEIFRAIAQKGNMTRAAEAIGLTQSAASMALADLENALGAALFYRKNRKLQLNHLGQALLKEADSFLAQAKKISGLANKTQDLVGEIKIGASSTIGNYVLPSYLLEFKRKYPLVNVELVVGNTEKIIEGLLSWDLDLGFIEGECAESKIHKALWLSDELVVFCKKGHALMNKKKITFQDLADYPWILRESGSGTLAAAEFFLLDRLKLEMPWLRLGSSEAVKIAVQQSEALSILSKFVLHDSLAKGNVQIIDLPKFRCKRDFYQVSLRGRFEDAIVKAFREFMVGSS